MPKQDGGKGREDRPKRAEQIRADFGHSVPPILDLNKADPKELAAHPLIGSRLGAKLVRLRDAQSIGTPHELLHAGIIDHRQLQALEQFGYGRLRLRPLLRKIEIDGARRAYVDEEFALRISWHHGLAVPVEILSIAVRMPSGRRYNADVRLSESDLAARALVLPGFVSSESGELTVFATLRDAKGQISQQSEILGVFTRNPVQIFVTPGHHTQSGVAGAPQFDFAQSRWNCNAAVRWVNGENRSVNLGRRVDVEVSDAGAVIRNFSFNLSADIVIPARSTIYGSWMTWHSSGSIFDVFSAKGDLTFRYTMNGSGFSPSRSQVWRVMRTIGYNLIRVGDFTAAERSEYTRAAGEIASDIFRSRDMTVYGTERYRIEGTRDMDADKARWRFIDNDDEFRAMASKYSVANWYMDVFQVEGYSGGFGASFVNAPRDKNGDHSGIVIGRDSDTVNLGQTYAHEAGHHLGLEHADEDDGCSDTDPASPTISDNFIFSSSRRDSAVVTGCQINKMRQHGFVRSMTPGGPPDA